MSVCFFFFTMESNILRSALLVEDEPMSRMILERHLRRAGFSRTLVATNGYEALNVLPGGDCPDIIFTDVHMPDIDGVSLVSYLRQTPSFATIPIVAVTADPSDSHDWKAEGFSDYLGKPYTFEDLKSALERLGLVFS